MSMHTSTSLRPPEAEHVLLESDEDDSGEVPGIDRARKVQAGVRLHSRVRGGRLSLDVFDYRYLAVQTRRPWSAPSAYVLDLRFVDPALTKVRHVPKRWWQATIVLILLAALGTAWLATSGKSLWNQAGLPVFVLLYAGTLVTAMLSTYLTTETVVLRSRNGRARLLEYTGGLGTFRALRAFETKLAAHVRHTLAAASRDKQRRLRNEMREHQRLKDCGVIAQPEYEESKARILRSYD